MRVVSDVTDQWRHLETARVGAEADSVKNGYETSVDVSLLVDTSVSDTGREIVVEINWSFVGID